MENRLFHPPSRAVGIHDDGLVPELTKCKILKEKMISRGVIQPLLHGLREISRQDVVVLDEPDVS